MLPIGAAHIPCSASTVAEALCAPGCSPVLVWIDNGTGKIARRLGVDYGDAVVCSAASMQPRCGVWTAALLSARLGLTFTADGVFPSLGASLSQRRPPR